MAQTPVQGATYRKGGRKVAFFVPRATANHDSTAESAACDQRQGGEEAAQCRANLGLVDSVTMARMFAFDANGRAAARASPAAPA